MEASVSRRNDKKTHLSSRIARQNLSCEGTGGTVCGSRVEGRQGLWSRKPVSDRGDILRRAPWRYQ